MSEWEEVAEAPSGGGGGGGTGEVTLAEALDLALALQREGRVEPAMEIYRRVLGAAPDHVDALHFLGLSLYQQKRHDEGLALVQRAVALAPGHADAQNNLGNMLLGRGDLDGAEAAYRAVLAAMADHVAAHTNLAVILRRRGDLAGAEASLRRALAIDPERGEAYHLLGAVLRRQERDAEALAAFQRAVELLPYATAMYQDLGFALYSVGRVADAADVYRRWLELDPKNPLPRHLLAACTGQEVPERASDAFVTETFDRFAGSFDDTLGRLGYRAPALVAAAVAALADPPRAALDVLDAGAGTGLCGPLLRPYARRLVAVDLSPRMLEKAAARAVYDQLDAAELTAYMRERPAAFDLIASADTLVYFGDLGAVTAAASAALRPGGHLVFTVEEAVPGDGAAGGYRLNPHGRYAHTPEHVRGALVAAGLAPLALVPVELREETQQPVKGLVCSARKAAP